MLPDQLLRPNFSRLQQKRVLPETPKHRRYVQHSNSNHKIQQMHIHRVQIYLNSSIHVQVCTNCMFYCFFTWQSATTRASTSGSARADAKASGDDRKAKSTSPAKGTRPSGSRKNCRAVCEETKDVTRGAHARGAHARV